MKNAWQFVSAKVVSEAVTLPDLEKESVTTASAGQLKS
jgi:hypothetical protein